VPVAAADWWENSAPSLLRPRTIGSIFFGPQGHLSREGACPAHCALDLRKPWLARIKGHPGSPPRYATCNPCPCGGFVLVPL
jgi:hypothetical protein